MEREHCEGDISQDPNTGGAISAEESTTNTPLESERLKLTLALIGILLITLSVIFAGYLHGHMSIKAVYHSIMNFT